MYDEWGWKQTYDPETALMAANEGTPTFAVWQGEGRGASGHIQMVRPSSDLETAAAQAGGILSLEYPLMTELENSGVAYYMYVGFY